MKARASTTTMKIFRKVSITLLASDWDARYRSGLGLSGCPQRFMMMPECQAVCNSCSEYVPANDSSGAAEQLAAAASRYRILGIAGRRCGVGAAFGRYRSKALADLLATNTTMIAA